MQVESCGLWIMLGTYETTAIQQIVACRGRDRDYSIGMHRGFNVGSSLPEFSIHGCFRTFYSMWNKVLF